MEAIDINLPITPDMLHIGQRPTYEMPFTIEAGDAYDVSRWYIGAHTGTHIDAPSHYVAGGASIDEIPLEVTVGRTRVLDLRGVEEEITAADLETAGLGDARRILMLTRNSTDALTRKERSETWVALAPDGARLLVARGVVFAGIDYLTMECPAYTENWDTHHILLGANIIILENANLAGVEPGDYTMVCRPVPFEGREAAPAPTVLLPLMD